MTTYSLYIYTSIDIDDQMIYEELNNHPAAATPTFQDFQDQLPEVLKEWLCTVAAGYMIHFHQG